MKKLIATIALGTFFITMTTVSNSFAHEDDGPNTAAEITATEVANEAAALGTKEALIAAAAAAAIIAAAAAASGDDNPAAHGHGHGHGHGH